jgi:galacturan 1,4-alpha-galacturonidase
VTYKDVTIDNCDYALQVDNCYQSESDECKKYPSDAKLLDIHFMNITGRTSKKYDPVVANIACPPNGSCDLTFKQWSIVSPSGNSTVRCSNYDHPSGITCIPNNFS